MAGLYAFSPVTLQEAGVPAGNIREERNRMKNGHTARSYPRITEPLIRVNGRLHPGTWDDALDRAAEGFRRNLDTRGAHALGIFSCSKSTNEVNFLAQKLARVAFGTNNIDSCNRT
jgi:predicted molibdopterin-dependent oxidoreductase YjgC